MKDNYVLIKHFRDLMSIENSKERYLAYSGREADTLAVSDATVTLAGLGGCNHVSGLDIEIHDDLPLGEFYVSKAN